MSAGKDRLPPSVSAKETYILFVVKSTMVSSTVNVCDPLAHARGQTWTFHSTDSFIVCRSSVILHYLPASSTASATAVPCKKHMTTKRKQHAIHHREQLIVQAKQAWRQKQESAKGDGVVTDPEDPRFDLEKLVAKWEKESL
ncbi:hypothetical protein EV401DRAFT_1889796 [Pisolithus croceorrhizus]|nr:hypothetical protein EV401DRAFT_1889796 [Pisolithus croceorrhizus]